MAERRRLILHLGLPKTGTTTIQTFLRNNPEALAQAGFIYPSPGADVADHPFFRPSPFQPRIAQEISHEALADEIRVRGEPRASSVGDTPLWRAAFGQIDRSAAHTAIVSFENFARQPHVWRFDALAPWLDAFAVRGIVYLRRQEDWATSLFGQGVRGKGRWATTFSQFARRLEGQLAYSRVMDAVGRHLPVEDLAAVDFHVACAEGLMEDFARRVGLPRQALPAPGELDTRNSSPPASTVLFLLCCNQAAVSDADFLAVRKRLTALGDRGPELRPGLDLASPEERARIRAISDIDAPRLEDRWGVAFGPRSDTAKVYRPFDRDDFDQIRRAIDPRLPASARAAVRAIGTAPV